MSGQDLLSVEVMLSERGVALCVPADCGLSTAELLSVSVARREVFAMRQGSILPVDFPMLSAAHCAALLAAQSVPVAEFLPTGMKNGYFLPVVEAH